MKMREMRAREKPLALRISFSESEDENLKMLHCMIITLEGNDPYGLLDPGISKKEK